MSTDNSQPGTSHVPDDSAVFTPTYKFPQAKAVVEAMKENLATNMADPDAYWSRKDARDLARASPSDVTEGAQGEAGKCDE